MPETSKIPTTLEMDGLFTENDINNRNQVVMQCRNCKQWTQMAYRGIHSAPIPCMHCGSTDYDRSSRKSLRTYNPLTDAKRRPK